MYIPYLVVLALMVVALIIILVFGFTKGISGLKFILFGISIVLFGAVLELLFIKGLFIGIGIFTAFFGLIVTSMGLIAKKE